LTSANSIKESAIQKPSDTVVFGEKKNRPADSLAMDYYMDLNEGVGNDADRVEHGRHSGASARLRGAGSNFAFADSSVRFLKYGASVWPLHLWAISDTDRQRYAFQPP
jgi:prepilin-type processing-associated H-X9-DG protein